MPDVSIIIPVYNIKTLLPRCVASLQAQTWQDFEVWLVDDGSTDGSGPALRRACGQGRPYPCAA